MICGNISNLLLFFSFLFPLVCFSFFSFFFLNLPPPPWFWTLKNFMFKGD